MSAERPLPEPSATLVGSLPPGVLSFLPLWIGSSLVVAGAIALLDGLVGPGARWPVLGPLRISWDTALLAALAAAAVASFAVSRWARARSGTVEVFEDRVVVSRLVNATAAFYSDVDRFSDDSSAFVVLRPSGDPLPTPTEAGRTALLAALAHAGVPRLAPEERARPRARPDRGPSIVAAGSPPLPELALGLTALVLVLALTNSWLWASESWSRWIFKFVVGPQLLVLFAPAVLAAQRLAPRRGVVVLHGDRVQLGRPRRLRVRRPVELGWDDVVGWRSSSRDYLRLVLRPGLLRGEHGEPAVPTLTPELRARVEALLAARGVPCL